MSIQGKYHMGLLSAAVLAIELVTWVLMVAAWWFLAREVPSFRFDKPDALWGMAAGPALVLVFLLHIAWRNRALGRFATPTTLFRMVPGVSTARVLVQFLLVRHGLGLVVLAMAGPQYGTRSEEVKSEGIDVVVAIDVSNSMACEDLKPNRMEAARRAMAQLIDRMQGDRLGMVVFAGEAYVQLPITTDRSAAKLFLNSVGMGTVGLQGTAIGSAIALAQRSFGDDATESRVIIVITDGENHEDDAEGAARDAANAGIIVHTVGMGTPQGGPIPVRQNGKLAGFRKDNSGSTVVTRLDEAMLRGIATVGNGTYVRGDLGASGIVQLVDDLKSMERSEKGTYRYVGYEDQFQYPLGLGILFLLLSLSFGERGNTARSMLGQVGPLGMSVLPLLCLSSCTGSDEHQRELAIRKGNALYASANYTDAASEYGRFPEDATASYNRGNAHYRQEQWSDAVAAFTDAVDAESADTIAGATASTFHNLGCARLKQAHHADSLVAHYTDLLGKIKIDGEDIARKVELYVMRDSLRRENRRLNLLVDSALVQAEDAFRNALRRAPTDEESRYDLAVAHALIAARPTSDPGGGDGDKDQDGNQELGERARMILQQADEMVDAYRFQEALTLLNQGLQEDPSLEQKQEYMKKLETVTEAAKVQ